MDYRLQNVRDRLANISIPRISFRQVCDVVMKFIVGNHDTQYEQSTNTHLHIPLEEISSGTLSNSFILQRLDHHQMWSWTHSTHSGPITKAPPPVKVNTNNSHGRSRRVSPASAPGMDGKDGRRSVGGGWWFRCPCRPHKPDRQDKLKLRIFYRPHSWRHSSETDSSSESGVYQSVFNGRVPNLLTPSDQLERSIRLGKLGLEREYVSILEEQYTFTTDASKLPQNRAKNRYIDVLCYDYTRVILDRVSESGGDYINANYVHSYEQRDGYICCQGPLPNTVADFWLMIWQEKCRTIVALTRPVEKGRKKCAEYWPSVNGNLTFGSISVKNVGIQRYGEIIISKLVVTKDETTRRLNHIYFVHWPDYGVPSTADSIIHLVLAMRACQSDEVSQLSEWQGHSRGPPIVIHCSAGIGRTGTIVATDICMYLLDQLNQVNILLVVNEIRKQRAGLVQTSDQYMYIHQAVLTWAKHRNLLGKNFNIDIPKSLESGKIVKVQ